MGILNSIKVSGLLICILFVMPFANTKGQTPRSYFYDNIMELDPIEGVWNVVDNMYLKAGRLSRSDTETYTLTIKRTSGNKFQCEGTSISLQRIGETNAYQLSYYSNIAGGNKSVQIVLESNGFAFSYSTTEQASRWADAMRSDTFRFVKEYHTASMYAEALEKQRQAEYAAREEAVRRAAEAAKPTEWTGSGFALQNGYLVTNYHVVEEAKSIEVSGVKGDFNIKYKAEIVGRDSYNDLALLKITDSRFNGFGNIPYSVKTRTAEVGEDVFVLGYPLTSTMGDEIKLTTGVVSSKTGFQGDVSLYQISAPVQPGNSGGPLFDNKGNLIGIVSAKHSGAENVSYAIKTSYLQNLIESVSMPNILPSLNSISSKPLTDKVKVVKNYVYLIECSSKEKNTSTITPLPPKNTNSNKPVTTNPNVELNKKTHKNEILSSKPNVDTRNCMVVNNPEFLETKEERLTIEKVTLASTHTIVEFSVEKERKNKGFYVLLQIDPNAHIVANGKDYTLQWAEGITVYPEYTAFPANKDRMRFILYFPGLPKGTKSFDFVESESCSWKITGVKLR